MCGYKNKYGNIHINNIIQFKQVIFTYLGIYMFAHIYIHIYVYVDIHETRVTEKRDHKFIFVVVFWDCLFVFRTQILASFKCLFIYFSENIFS